jgi:pSer/pThr/pTyr-binding forkhead associated (FHA) protein
MFRYYLLIDKKKIEVTNLDTFSIGRDGDIKIPDDPTISRRHCLIALPKKWPKNNAVWLFDISRNGCFVNGKSLIFCNRERASRIYSGDVIQIGTKQIQFLISNERLPSPFETLS